MGEVPRSLDFLDQHCLTSDQLVNISPVKIVHQLTGKSHGCPHQLIRFYQILSMFHLNIGDSVHELGPQTWDLAVTENSTPLSDRAVCEVLLLAWMVHYLHGALDHDEKSERP